MTLLRVPAEIEAIVTRPGQDWTPAERHCVVVWLNERAQRRSLLAFCFLKVRDRFKAAAADHAEEAWASFCADQLSYAIRAFDPARAPFGAFLRMTLTNHARKEASRLRLHAERWASETDAERLVTRREDPERVLLHGEKARWLRAGVNSLPPGERAVVVLHYFKDRKLKEIASVLGISFENAKVRLHRARERLKGHLRSEGL